MKLPKLTAEQSLVTQRGRFPGKAVWLDPQSVRIISDTECLLLGGMNVRYCQSCLWANGGCFVVGR